MTNKFFLSVIFAVMACFSLYAAESDCHCGLDPLSDCHSALDPLSDCHSALDPLSDCHSALDPMKDCHCGLDPQSPYIYIAENAEIYNPDLLLSKQDNSINNHKKTAPVKTETPKPVKNDITEHEPEAVVLPAIPFAPSSSSFLQGGRESAAVTPQQRNDKSQPAAKIYCEKIAHNTNNSDLSLYHLKQRQKLSPSATQCGMLTSFGSTSPPAP